MLRLARMAWRNLWRHRRRTFLTLSSIAFGTALAILFTAIGDSNWKDMIDLAARLGGGHVTLQHPEYLDTPTLSRTVHEANLREVALSDPEVERAVTRISGQLMLSSAGQSYGAGFIALDPATEDIDTLSLLDAIAEGEFFASSEEQGILLGSRLAENLDVKIGRKVVFTTTDRDGEIVRDMARVRGILHTGSPTVDGYLCLLPLDRMRGVLGYDDDEAIQVALFLGDQRRADAVAARLSKQGGDAVAAVPWHQNQPDLSSFIAMKVAGAIFMEVVIGLLVAAGIFNTLFVSVMERVREFGIMTALGFPPGSLFALVMFESLWLGLLGLGLAALVAAWPYYYLSTTGIDIAAQLGAGGSEVAGVAITTIMRAYIYPENLAMIASAALGATLLSGLYPAWRAGHVEPVESIKLV
jgi:ABC-type lipoprotein release transport system permease subunit